MDKIEKKLDDILQELKKMNKAKEEKEEKKRLKEEQKKEKGGHEESTWEKRLDVDEENVAGMSGTTKKKETGELAKEKKEKEDGEEEKNMNKEEKERNELMNQLGNEQKKATTEPGKTGIRKGYKSEIETEEDIQNWKDELQDRKRRGNNVILKGISEMTTVALVISKEIIKESVGKEIKQDEIRLKRGDRKEVHAIVMLKSKEEKKRVWEKKDEIWGRWKVAVNNDMTYRQRAERYKAGMREKAAQEKEKRKDW